MKAVAIPAVLLGLTLAAGAQAPAGKPAMRDAATHEALAQELSRASREDPLKHFTPATGEDPSKLNPPADLLAESDILCFGGVATLVPKRAVIHVPAEMKARLEMQPGARLCDWLEFFSGNRGWVTAVEVTRRQAEGVDPLPAETLQSMSKSRNLIVATYQGGPISVLPLKQPVAETTATSSQPQTSASR